MWQDVKAFLWMAGFVAVGIALGLSIYHAVGHYIHNAIPSLGMPL